MIVSFPSIYLATRFNLFSRAYSFQLIASFNTVYIFIVGYFGFKQTTIFSDLNSEEPLKTMERKYAKSGLNKELADNYLKRLNELVAIKKPFLNGNLSSKELASDLGISANNLSQIINQIEGKTFYQYINDKRIEEVVLLMTSKDNNHVSNEGLGYHSDINSRSTFLKAFKQKLGMSPSEFRKKIG